MMSLRALGVTRRGAALARSSRMFKASQGGAALTRPVLALPSPLRAAMFHSTPSVRDTFHVPKKEPTGNVELHELIESWSRSKFYHVGAGMTAGLAVIAVLYGPLSIVTLTTAVPVSLWWYVGLHDINQTSHTIKRNFPVIGNLRYLLESVRPEIRQYFIESDNEHNPISRAKRTLVYQRAKGARDSLPFGTREDVYQTGYEWANHSLYPKVATLEKARVLFGGPECKQPYSGSILNISGMSYGAISDNAVLALNKAAKLGNFSHNTGEGGARRSRANKWPLRASYHCERPVAARWDHCAATCSGLAAPASRSCAALSAPPWLFTRPPCLRHAGVSAFHKEHGGDLVWNIGTGYFGCRRKDGGFDAARFRETASIPSVKMIEIKLSQGAKPAHGGILPASKVRARAKKRRLGALP